MGIQPKTNCNNYLQSTSTILIIYFPLDLQVLMCINPDQFLQVLHFNGILT